MVAGFLWFTPSLSEQRISIRAGTVNAAGKPRARFIVGLFGEFACIVHRRGTEISYRPDGCCFPGPGPLLAAPMVHLRPYCSRFGWLFRRWAVFSNRKRLAKPLFSPSARCTSPRERFGLISTLRRSFRDLSMFLARNWWSGCCLNYDRCSLKISRVCWNAETVPSCSGSLTSFRCSGWHVPWWSQNFCEILWMWRNIDDIILTICGVMGLRIYNGLLFCR